MAKIELDIRLNPTLDKGAVKKQIAQIEADVTDLDININIDTQSAENALLDVMDVYAQLEAAMDEVISVAIDTKEGEEALDRLNKAIRDVEDANFDVDGLAAEFSKTKKEVEDLNNTQKLALAQMKLSGQEGSDAYKKLQSEIDETEKKIDELGEAMGDLGDVGEPEGFMNFMAKFEALGNLGDSLTSFSTAGKDMQKAMREVQAATGATVKEMENIKASAIDAFRGGVGESVAEAVKTIGYANQLLGDFLDTSEIDKFVKSAQGIANTFDKDINEVIAGSRTFIANFALEGQEAANLVALAMQNGGSKMDDVLDTLDEYSQLMVQAGYSAEQFVGILDVGMQNGVRDTDKLADSIKEMQIRLNAGDTQNALNGISGPITQQIQDIVALGEQGQKTVQEVAQESAKMISDAYAKGDITAAMRDQLTVAISGTMAEDVGGLLWTNIFSADIDETAIRTKAQQAGELVSATLGPITFIDKVQKELELFATIASEKFAGVASAVGATLTTVSQVAPGIMLLQQNFASISSVGSKAFEFLKTGISNAFIGIKAAFVGGAVSATAFWSAATLGVALLIPLLITLYNEFEPFKQLIDDVASFFIDGFNTIWAYISAFASNFGTIVSAIGEAASAYLNPANWFSSDGAELRQKAKDNLVNAVMGAVKDADNDLKKQGLGETLESSIVLKGDIDKNNQLKKFIADYKNAKTEADKNSLAKVIQEQVPGALTGMKTITKANGELVDVYEVNIEKAEEFADAQDKGYSADVIAKQQQFKEGIMAMAYEYENTKKRAEDMQEQIINAVKSGGDTTALRAEYQEVLDSMNTQKAKIGEVFNQADSVGATTEETENLLRAMNLLPEPAEETSDAIKTAKKDLEDAKKATANWAEAFNKAKTSAGSMTQAYLGELSGLKMALQNGTLTREEYNKKYAETIARAKQASKEEQNLNNILEDVTKSVVRTRAEMVSALDARIQKEIQAVELSKEKADIDREIAILQRGTPETVYDELIAQEAIITALKEKADVLNINIKKAITSEQRNALKGQLNDINNEIDNESKNLRILSIQTNIEEQTLIKEINEANKQLQLKKIEWDIQIGQADENALLDFYTKQADIYASERIRVQGEITKAESDGNLILMLQKEQELQDINNKDLENQQKTHDAKMSLLDRFYNLEKEKLGEQNEILQAQADLLSSIYSEVVGSLEDAFTGSIEDATARRLDALDKQSQSELDRFVGTEEQKKALQEKYNAEKIALEEKAQAEIRSLQEQSAGAMIAINNANMVKSMELKRKELELEIEIAKKRDGENSATVAKLQRQLDVTNKVIKEKGEVMTGIWEILGNNIDDIVGNMFAGNAESLKENMKAILSQIVGFISNIIAAWAWEQVLLSPYWKALSIASGPGAPAVTAGGIALLSGLIRALAGPFLNSMLSFPSGGWITEPTTFIAGDGSRLGGENTEAVLRSDQMQRMMANVLEANNRVMAGYFDSIVSALSQQRIIGKLQGSDMLLITQRAGAEESRRNTVVRN